MTSPKIGEILEHRPTGNFFEVKKVTRDWVMLFSRDGSRQILTEIKSFDYLFRRVFLVKSPREKMGLRTSLGILPPRT
jgi:hypothetical protein